MRRQGLAALLLFVTASGAPAWARAPAGDTVTGAQDHPLLSRYEGATMVGYEVKAFDAAMLPAGKRYHDKERRPVFEKSLTLEGKLTRIAYNYPAERSPLEVMRTDQAALDKAGMKTVFACAKETCGDDFGEYWLTQRLGNKFVKGRHNEWSPFNYGRRDMRYLLASGTRPDGSAVHVATYVVAPVKNFKGGIYLEIVEGKSMETGKVAANLNAAEMAKGIADEGKVAVYGVYFDTGKAEVKPDSQPALAEMAKMLQQDPKLKVFVVGHTDNQGVLAQNLALSQQRADAVVKALVAGYQVDPKRLSAKGVAAYAPLASNRRDEGRQKNRRVELVEQ